MSSDTMLRTQTGRYSIVQAEVPGLGFLNLGVLLEDPQSDALHLRFRRDLDSFASDEDLEVLEALAIDLAGKARELGAGKLLDYLETTLSGSIRLTDREEVLIDDFSRAVDRLY